MVKKIAAASPHAATVQKIRQKIPDTVAAVLCWLRHLDPESLQQ